MAQLLLRGELLGEIEGVLFDKDGTLSHSEPRLITQGTSRIHAACQCYADITAGSDQRDSAAETKLRALLHRAYGLSDQGVSPDGLLAVASRQHNLLATATVFSLMGLSWPRALLLAERTFAEAVNNEVGLAKLDKPMQSSPLLPAARTFLDQLRDAGVTCAVISNDTRAGIQAFLRSHDLDGHIAGIWSAEDLPSKPNPEAVQGLCKILGLNPRQCALIGDADSDLLMARQAGISHSLGYVAGWQQDPDLTEHEHLITHWNELNVTGRSNCS